MAIPPSVIVDDQYSVIAMTTIQGKARQSGIPVSTPLNEIFVVQGSKVTEIRPFYWDTGAVAAAITGAKATNAVIADPLRAILN